MTPHAYTHVYIHVFTHVCTHVGAQALRLAPAGNGFGLHLVNVSAHLTTGGMTTAEHRSCTRTLRNMPTANAEGSIRS